MSLRPQRRSRVSIEGANTAPTLTDARVVQEGCRRKDAPFLPLGQNCRTQAYEATARFIGTKASLIEELRATIEPVRVKGLIIWPKDSGPSHF